jgi:hypothetical protein
MGPFLLPFHGRRRWRHIKLDHGELDKDLFS